MFREGKFLVEQEGSREILPKELAKRFIAGTLAKDAPVVHEGDKSIIYRCFERPVDLPGIAHAALRIDYRKYHVQDSERSDQLRFEYTSDEKPIVEMHLFIQKPDLFILHHRYVAPQLRQSGLGSRLFSVVDQWLHQVTEECNQPVQLGLQTGQESVMRWAEKMGFVVREDQKELLDEIRNHPDHFDQDYVIISDESREQGVVKDLYTFRKGESGRYMEDAVRLTFTKQIPSEKPGE